MEKLRFMMGQWVSDEILVRDLETWQEIWQEIYRSDEILWGWKIRSGVVEGIETVKLDIRE